mgnify:CR=1 FL=1
MAHDADLLDKLAKRNKFFLNFFKDSKDEIDFDGYDIIVKLFLFQQYSFRQCMCPKNWFQN